MENLLHDNHPEHWKKVLADPEAHEKSLSWLRNDRLDSWRHRRIRDSLQPLFRHAVDAKWLTVGDGRYGSDAIHLLGTGIRDVHATDLVDDLLRISAEKGFINSYAAENSEKLSFADDEFDYVYCKESFHHFARPYLSLYEMFRVCRDAVILTEPLDPALSNSLLSLVKRILKGNAHDFEPVGNYVYCVSERELEKFLLGMGLRYCAFKNINDAYIEGIEYVPVTGGSFQEKLVRFKLKARILIRDVLSYLRLCQPSLVVAILFKCKPDSSLMADLKKHGYKVRELPKNPYA